LLFIEPELRENDAVRSSVLSVARSGPSAQDDIRGILHAHTDEAKTAKTSPWLDVHISPPAQEIP
jgi:hypothetical protein